MDYFNLLKHSSDSFKFITTQEVHEFSFHYKQQLINLVYTENITEYMNTH